MGSIWTGIKDILIQGLEVLHTGLSPIFGDAAWGWAIIALTIVIRVLLLPLAVKQTRSMKGMQELQPQVKAIQKKYKVDRDLMRSNPEAYREKKNKMNEEVMALYKEAGVNPASGCLPLLLQAPIFFALFHVLRDYTTLAEQPFYFFTRYVEGTPSGLGAAVSAAAWPGWLLIALMGGTMFITQKQMMARNATDGAQAQQQKIMLYAMPAFLAFVSFNLPIGVLLYWVTTNLWQALQQLVILREVSHTGAAAATAAADQRNGTKASGTQDRTSGSQKPNKTPGGKNHPNQQQRGKKNSPRSSSNGRGASQQRSGAKRSHLPDGKRDR